MTEPTPDPTAWKNIYKMGGAAALTAVLLFCRCFGVEMRTFKGFGLFDVPETAPVSAAEWVALFQDNWFVGLTLFNLFDLVNYVLSASFSWRSLAPFYKPFYARYAQTPDFMRSNLTTATRVGKMCSGPRSDVSY